MGSLLARSPVLSSVKARIEFVVLAGLILLGPAIWLISLLWSL